MARSRNIKPQFFLNENLAVLSPHSRLLYIGLWCLADCKGRLEDRPMRIKASLFPYEDLNIDALLEELAVGRERFIVRYEIEGNRYIEIPAFHKHQNPHKREKETGSQIPACPPKSPGLGPALSRTSTELVGCESDASPGLAPNWHSTGPADSLLLIPDSLTPKTGHSESDDSVCVSESCLEKSNQPTENQRFAQEGADYLISLNSPNHTNVSWIRGYLGIQFEELTTSRPDLPKPQILNCWRDTCDLATAKNATSPQWFKTTFKNKLDSLTPEDVKTHVLDQASGQSINRWDELKTYNRIRHTETGEIYNISELRPDGTGSTGVLCGMTYLCTGQLEGIAEEESCA
jgi:hypothetical protein